MTKQLIYYSEQLDKVEVVDKAYLAATNDYQGNVTSVRSCYDRLINDGLLAVGSSPATTAYTVLDDRQNKINTIKGILVPELQKVVAAKNLVVETNTKLAESNSSQEISAIFTAYTATVDDNNYPTAETEGARRAEMMRDKASAESDLKSSRETNQNLYGLQATCDSMRVEPLNGGGN
jgi:hypothetical protein